MPIYLVSKGIIFLDWHISEELQHLPVRKFNLLVILILLLFLLVLGLVKKLMNLVVLELIYGVKSELVQKFSHDLLVQVLKLFEIKSFFIVPPVVINILKLLSLDILLNYMHLLLHLILFALPLLNENPIDFLFIFEFLFDFYLHRLFPMDQLINIVFDFHEILVI